MVVDKRYREHVVFAQLSKYAEFYDDLSFAVFGFSTLGTVSAVNIDSYVFLAIKGTLKSIHTVLYQGRINDAYALLRKYYDSVIINVYTNLYLSDHISLENFVVEKINRWVEGKEKLPTYREMMQYIRSSEKLARINTLLYADDTYKHIRNRCNDHTHYNFYQYMLLNNDEIYLGNRLAVLDGFSKDLGDIFVMHFSYLFYLKGHYMMASDYIDSLEVGLTPEEDSQYLVAPFVQEIFDNEIKVRRMDLAEEIKNATSMMLK